MYLLCFFVHLSQHGNSLLQFVQARASSIYVGAGCFLTTCCICCVAGIDANMSSLLQDNIQTMPSIEVASICLCVHSAMLIAAAGLARTTRFSVTAGWDALENCWCENIINCKGEYRNRDPRCSKGRVLTCCHFLVVASPYAHCLLSKLNGPVVNTEGVN